MAAAASEPALSFWLHYAQREGALVEDRGEQALVVLPPELQRADELPEELTVTADPDVAREDRAVLMIAGHPAVERAAAAVLDAGDAGAAYLPWPASRPLARSELEACACELAPIDHGRIDAAGEPIATYLPLLRVGAMVSYAASLTLRFHEQEEAWVDARTGIEPQESVVAAACRGRPAARPDRPCRVLQPDFELALPSAHAMLETRATARQASLGAHARRSLELELARADAYYQGALASIDRRRTSATADRARTLEAQAEATRAEHTRRRREIEDEHSPRHDIRPFRLHLVHMPAVALPVQVRRGSTTFALELVWIPAGSEFAPMRCPSCGAPEPLVATRDRLGCRACARPARTG